MAALAILPSVCRVFVDQGDRLSPEAQIRTPVGFREPRYTYGNKGLEEREAVGELLSILCIFLLLVTFVHCRTATGTQSFISADAAMPSYHAKTK